MKLLFFGSHYSRTNERAIILEHSIIFFEQNLYPGIRRTKNMGFALCFSDSWKHKRQCTATNRDIKHVCNQVVKSPKCLRCWVRLREAIDSHRA